jgi:hypothetical protein
MVERAWAGSSPSLWHQAAGALMAISMNDLMQCRNLHQHPTEYVMHPLHCQVCTIQRYACHTAKRADKPVATIVVSTLHRIGSSGSSYRLFFFFSSAEIDILSLVVTDRSLFYGEIELLGSYSRGVNPLHNESLG